MKKGILWLVVSSLMALTLLAVSCGQAVGEDEDVDKPGVKVTKSGGEQEKEKEEVAEEEKVVDSTTPRYGGTLTLVQNADITVWDDIITRTTTPGITFGLTNEPLWAGDWAKGAAGGYGTGETDWAYWYDRFDQKEGWVAESWDWTVDEEKQEGTIVYQIRPNINFALNNDSEASRLVGGRAMTMDDVIFSLKQMITDERAYIYRANPELRDAQLIQTGDWELSITLPIEDLYVGIGRFGNHGRVVPPEVVEKYGDMADWKNSVGSGPYMLTDFVPSSAATLVRNPNYWGTDPVGPGKGNQLPYLDGYRYLVITDASTRLAAMRTGKLDQIVSLSWEDAATMRAQRPELNEIQIPGGSMPSVSMNQNNPPYNDVRVRRALMMATDFEEIVQTMQNGNGQILTWPYAYSETYADLYLGLDDPDMPASVKELYVYNPEGAKALLAEAGYPDGFKTTAIIRQVDADYYSIIKAMWEKVGVDVDLDVREVGSWAGVFRKKAQEAIGYYPQGPTSMWYTGISIMGPGAVNASFIDDPVINETMADIRIALVTEGEAAGLKMYREMLKHVLDQAYTIPGVSGTTSHFWWPWLKNYSGEYSVGFAFLNNWVKWVWVDQDLKKEMGY